MAILHYELFIWSDRNKTTYKHNISMQTPLLNMNTCCGYFPVDFHYLEGRGVANTKKYFNCMFKNSSIVRQPKGLTVLLVTCH